jgi:nucleoid DNA-binding protein
MKKEQVLDLTKEVLELGSKKEVEAKLAEFDKLVKAFAEKLEVGDKAKLGSFIEIEKKHVEAKHTDARVGRNPRTGESIQIPAKDTPAHDEVKIKATKALSKAE